MTVRKKFFSFVESAKESGKFSPIQTHRKGKKVSFHEIFSSLSVQPLLHHLLCVVSTTRKIYDRIIFHPLFSRLFFALFGCCHEILFHHSLQAFFFAIKPRKGLFFFMARVKIKRKAKKRSWNFLQVSVDDSRGSETWLNIFIFQKLILSEI